MNSVRPFQIPAYLQKYQSITSGGMKFEFVTQENITSEELLKIMQFFNKLGFLSFNVEQIELIDLINIKDIKIDRSKYEGKSYSQRLRNILFVLHQELGGTKETFQNFYEEKMEKLIEHFKIKINEVQ